MRPFESTDPLPKDIEKGADLEICAFFFWQSRAAGDGMIVHCSNQACIYHDSGLCKSESVYIQHKRCDTCCDRQKAANFMRMSYKARCSKRGGKYKADHTTPIK